MGRHLTYTDRILFEKLFNSGKSIIEIASILGCCRSTAYNERKRGLFYSHKLGFDPVWEYSADIAQRNTDFASSSKGQPIKLGQHYDFADYVSNAICIEHKSPDVIVGQLRASGAWTVCTTTLYSYIKRGFIPNVSVKDLYANSRRKRNYTTVQRHKRAPAGLSIERRPKSVNDRKSFGHWEMDLVIGKAKGKRQALLVLTERQTRFEIIMKLKDKTTKSVVSALDKIGKKYDFPAVFKSITCDNGVEFADCYGMEHDKKGNRRTTIYYCHPYSSAEKGTCENANKMIRRFLPKNTSFFSVSQMECDKIAEWMNSYPRRVLGYKTPAELFAQKVRRCRVKIAA